MVEYWHISDLFPGHRHVLQKFEHRMWHVFKSPTIKISGACYNNEQSITEDTYLLYKNFTKNITKGFAKKKDAWQESDFTSKNSICQIRTTDTQNSQQKALVISFITHSGISNMWAKHSLSMQISPHLPEIDSFVMTEFPVCHVSMVPDNFADMLRWHVLFLSINKAKLPLL